MAQTNLINLQIPADDLVSIKAAIETLRSTLLPHLKTINTKESRKMLKAGDNSVAFVNKAFEYSKQYEELVPRFLDMKSFSGDIAAVDTLQELVRAMTPIVEALDDSLLMSGSEAYEGALMFYQSVKAAAKANAPSAKAILIDLADHFKKVRQKP